MAQEQVHAEEPAQVTEASKPAFDDAFFEKLHELSDCVLKHSFTSPIKLLEVAEAAIQKGLDPEPFIQIHAQQTELARKILSTLLPDDRECSARIQEAWESIGWMNGAEEHMIQKYEENTELKDGKRVLKEGVPEEFKEYLLALPTFMHATRLVRRNLEKELFRSIAVAVKG
jgi:hypothetical protein